jgi:hypothetical protein
MTVYNKPLFFIGAILTFTGTYLDYSHVLTTVIVYILLILGLILMLIAFRKPKNVDDKS